LDGVGDVVGEGVLDGVGDGTGEAFAVLPRVKNHQAANDAATNRTMTVTGSIGSIYPNSRNKIVR